MLDLHDFSGLDRPRYLPPDGSQGLADLLGHGFHVVGLEIARQRRQDGLAGGCRVGIGHGDALRSLPVQNVEDVVVVLRDGPDDGHRHIEIDIGTRDRSLDRSGVGFQAFGVLGATFGLVVPKVERRCRGSTAVRILRTLRRGRSRL